MPSITDVINEKYNVSGGNIADALAQAAQLYGALPMEEVNDSIADMTAALYKAKNPSETTPDEPEVNE